MPFSTKLILCTTNRRVKVTHTTAAIELFFQAFEEHSNSGDISAHVSQFADAFLAAGPQGAQPVRAVDFAVALPKRKQLFDSLGCRSTSLVSIEPVALDGRYTLVRTRWRMVFDQAQEAPKEVLADSTFIVNSSGSGLKIVFYLAHRDIMAILKERGIMAGTA